MRHEEALKDIDVLFGSENCFLIYDYPTGKISLFSSRSSHKTLKASGCLLSLLSPVWRAKLCRGFSKESRWQLKLEESDAANFGKILDLFSGLGTEVAGIHELMDLGRMADQYGMDDVLSTVEDEAMRHLTIATCGDLYMGSGMAGMVRLEKASRLLALNNFDDFSKTEGFMALCEENLGDLLEDDGLRSDSEENVFEAVVSWIRNSENGRSRGDNLLRKIRFPLMSRSFLSERVEKMFPEAGLNLHTELEAEIHPCTNVTSRSLNSDIVFPRCSQKDVAWGNYCSGGETRISAGSDTFSLSICKDFLCCGLWNGSIHIWNIATLREEKILSGHKRVVCALVSWKQWLISASSDHLIMAWNIRTGDCEQVLRGHSGGVNSMAVANGYLLSASDDSTVKTWNISGAPSTWCCQQTQSAHKGCVRCVVTWGERAVSGSSDKTIRIWNIANGTLEKTLRGHKGVVYALVVKGDRLISSAGDRTVKRWSLTTGTCLATFQVDSARQSLWSIGVSGSKIVGGSVNGEVQVWSEESEGSSMNLEHSLKIATDQAVRHVLVDRGQVWACVGSQILVWGRPS